MSIAKICLQCQSPFETTNDDIALLEKLSPVFNGRKFLFPASNYCPECRYLQKLVHINQINLFERRCDADGEMIISHYPAGTSFPVFCQKHWYGDTYDDTRYGREFDFTRSFFEQLNELWQTVPHPALFTDYLQDDNSAYTNFAGKNKNCYLIFDSDENQDCYYSYSIMNCRNSSDLFRCQQMELCYESIDSKNCYNSAFLRNCDNCSDSYFLQNCSSSTNCIMSSNLSHKEYYVQNKPVFKEEFDRIKKQLESFINLEKSRDYFQNFCRQFPQKYMHGFQNEQVTGDYLINCKNAYQCYDSINLQDARYAYQTFLRGKDFMDTEQCGDAELIYNCSNLAYNAYNVAFTMESLHQIRDTYYSRSSFLSNNLFGCIGLKRKQYCILNQQYTKEAYAELVSKIIEHMQRTPLDGGLEWGNYFPATMSSVGYNISLAQVYYPLSKEEALSKGYRWYQEDSSVLANASSPLSDTIADVPDTITKELITCQSCSKNYRFVGQELRLYRSLGIPLPRNCFKCRHTARLALRNPRKLWERQCDCENKEHDHALPNNSSRCVITSQTSYAPGRAEKVYCEPCYLREIY